MASRSHPPLAQLLWMLEKGTAEKKQYATMKLLKHAPRYGKGAVMPLLRLAYDTRPWIQLEAVEALGSLRASGAQASMALISFLRSTNPALRDRAYNALRRIGVAAAPYLLLHLRHRKHSRPLRTLLLGMSPKVIPALVHAMADRHWLIRLQSVELLDAIGRPAIPFLIIASKQKQWRRRRQAVWLLGRRGPDAKSAIPALMKLSSHYDPSLRLIVKQALAKIRAPRRSSSRPQRRTVSVPTPRATSLPSPSLSPPG